MSFSRGHIPNPFQVGYPQNVMQNALEQRGRRSNYRNVVYTKAPSAEELLFESWLRNEVLKRAVQTNPHVQINEDDFCAKVKEWMRSHKKSATFKNFMEMKWSDIKGTKTLGFQFVVRLLMKWYSETHKDQMIQLLDQNFTLEERVVIIMWMQNLYDHNFNTQYCPCSFEYFINLPEKEIDKAENLSFLTKSTLKTTQMSLKQKLLTSKNNPLKQLLHEAEAEFEDDAEASSPRNALHKHLQMLLKFPRNPYHDRTQIQVRNHRIACRACANSD